MKKISLLLGTAALMVGCSQTPQKAILSAELEGLSENDSVLVICGENQDTLAAPNGVFTYEYTDSIAEMVRFHKLPKKLPNGMMEGFNMRPLVVLMQPNQPVSVKGTFKNYQVTGNQFYEEYNAATASLAEADSARQKENNAYMELLNNQAPREEIYAKFDLVKKADSIYQDQVVEYVSQHLDSDAALFLLFMNSSPKGEEIIGQFAETVKNGKLKNFYEKLNSYYETKIARRKAAEFIKEGKPAPDFTLQNIEGKPFTLSSLRGKYVVLDFWGSWCGWCIKGIPDMKEMYKKYNGKLEIVGVDCRDTEEKWKAAVEKHEIPWINVINSTEKGKDLTTTYNIAGFPTKIIVSPEGNIAKIVVGESPEFYEAIKDFMK